MQAVDFWSGISSLCGRQEKEEVLHRIFSYLSWRALWYVLCSIRDAVSQAQDPHGPQRKSSALAPAAGVLSGVQPTFPGVLLLFRKELGGI